MRPVLAFAVLAACSSPAAPRVAAPAAPAPDVDPTGPHQAAVAAQVQPLLDGEVVSSLVIGLYDAGKLEIYGFGRGPGNTPPTGRTLYEIGSVTKVYTSLLLADCVQRREVDFETPVAELMPPGVTVPTKDGQPIRMRQLALHSSGLPRLPPSIAASQDTSNPYARYGENELVADLVQSQLETTPGTQVVYSNYGAGLLGYALGRKIGVGYTKAVEARILGPLGLSDTMFALDARTRARFAQPTNDELLPVSHWSFQDALAGAGALISDARDQLKLIDLELDAAAGGKETLRRAMALTQEPQLDGGGQNTGLGWQIDSNGRYWHNGGTGGHHAFVSFDIKTRRGVVILSGTSTQIIDGLAPKLYKILAGETVATHAAPTAEQLAAFSGTYDFAGQQLKVSAQGRRLYVEGPGEPKIRMIPVGDEKFWIDSLQAIVVFERDAGKVARAVFVVGQQRLSANRVGD